MPSLEVPCASETLSFKLDSPVLCACVSVYICKTLQSCTCLRLASSCQNGIFMPESTFESLKGVPEGFLWVEPPLLGLGTQFSFQGASHRSQMLFFTIVHKWWTCALDVQVHVMPHSLF